MLILLSVISIIIILVCTIITFILGLAETILFGVPIGLIMLICVLAVKLFTHTKK